MITPDTPGRGRWLFWCGIVASLLGPVLFIVQFVLLRRNGTPWHAPLISTFGTLLLLASTIQRAGVVRIAALTLATGFAALFWFFLVVALKLPDYAGPAKPGERLPAFSTKRADGRTFTDADLRDGSRRAMVFFRGRW